MQEASTADPAHADATPAKYATPRGGTRVGSTHWIGFYDAETQAPWWYDERTGESTWVQPAEVDSVTGGHSSAQVPTHSAQEVEAVEWLDDVLCEEPVVPASFRIPRIGEDGSGGGDGESRGRKESRTAKMKRIRREHAARQKRKAEREAREQKAAKDKAARERAEQKRKLDEMQARLRQRLALKQQQRKRQLAEQRRFIRGQGRHRVPDMDESVYSDGVSTDDRTPRADTAPLSLSRGSPARAFPIRALPEWNATQREWWSPLTKPKDERLPSLSQAATRSHNLKRIGPVAGGEGRLLNLPAEQIWDDSEPRPANQHASDPPS